MRNQVTEKAFEAYIEDALVSRGGWRKGSLDEWDKANALFPAPVVAFLQDTQPKLWADMQALHGATLETQILATLVKELDTKGPLHVLRHGFKFFGKTFRLAYFKPAHGLNKEILTLFGKNRLTVTRQVPCHPNDSKTVDMVFALNGLPVATCELKNPATGQTWHDAIAQYRNDRDPRAPLFNGKRALVHFAADTDEVCMTTKLAKGATYFLPFNRGSNPGEVKCGAGNPQHPSGHRTGYFWNEVLQAESLLDILGSFMFVEKRTEKVLDGDRGPRLVEKKALVFPRYHQLDAVRKLVATANTEGAGHNYLIQHSAGSGKTNSISWLSHRLANLHDDNDRKIFDCVIVVTDRQVLDRQLQDAIYQIEHAQGVVKAIDENSKQLADALIDGTKIVITTLQKFPFVLRGLLRAAGAENPDKATAAERQQAKQWEAEIAKRKYAVIVDEAHSSQSGETARELKAILGAAGTPDNPDEPLDVEDRLNEVMLSRGPQPNLSFFAFTATPKGKTLELFGRKDASDTPTAFHVYSMRQAIEEGFILDVLQNYTTYKTFFKLVKAGDDDPSIPKRKGARAAAKFVSLHAYNIEQRIAIIVEHFREFVMHRLGGRAKAMVVTQSRLHAVRYLKAFRRYIEEKNYTDVRPLVAFSGTVRDPDTGEEFTEPSLNTDPVTHAPISEKQLPDRFASPDFQVLLVANKYQTGFDEPLLQAMYVDKRLDGVQAVQTLSRLNRMIPGKESPFVLDFVNTSEDIYQAFKPYYDVTSLQENSDPQQLESLKHELNEAQVYFWSEVEAFAQIFYRAPEKQTAVDHARLEMHVNPARDRFRQLPDDDARKEFRDRLTAYVRMYAFLSQIIPFGDAELERLYTFSRVLLPKLAEAGTEAPVNLGNDVALQYYRLQRTLVGRIALDEGEPNPVRSPKEVGTSNTQDEKAPLSEIIAVLNDRFGTEFTNEDLLFFEQIKIKAARDEQVVETALANPLEKFELGIRKLIEHLMVERMGENDRIVTRYMDDPDFQDAAFPLLAKAIFDAVHDDKNKQAS